MTTHEIPFTRSDLLQLLVGDVRGHKLRDYFIKAVEGQMKSLEVIDGIESTPERLFSLMAGNKDCFFHVPSYLYSVWKDACTDEALRSGPVQYMGVELVNWGREFIVAHIKLTGIDFANDRAHDGAGAD